MYILRIHPKIAPPLQVLQLYVYVAERGCTGDLIRYVRQKIGM